MMGTIFLQSLAFASTYMSASAKAMQHLSPSQKHSLTAKP
jgi:hypothetical protein